MYKSWTRVKAMSARVKTGKSPFTRAISCAFRDATCERACLIIILSVFVALDGIHDNCMTT